MNMVRNTLREIKRYPSAVAGLLIIAALIVLSIYTVITMPYSRAVELWRGGEDIWGESPKNALPAWYNLFRTRKLPETIVLETDDDAVVKSREAISEDMTEVVMVFPVDYPYDDFPQELTIYFDAQYQEKQPHVSITWLTPDEREIHIGDFSVRESETYRISQDERLTRHLDGHPPERGLFMMPGSEPPTAVQGEYQLRVSGILFEEEGDIDAKLVVYGQVAGVGGTDHRRRDLAVALLWGTPVALAFGLLAALGTTLTTMVIAAVGVWYGGWVDNIVQRITQVNLILPFLPILIMVGTLHSRSIWVMLGVTILLSIFGGAVLTYRAIFLQVKESPYIEAARAYGAGNGRIVFFYLIPRIVPVIIPQLVRVIPTFVFLEAGLAVLGLGDPVLPTWGKIIDDARANGALFNGQYYWVLEPTVLLMLTGLAFAMVGFALDRIFNPRLRGL
jgi:peptide/nickel transport system permease protein